jgi:aspartokinase-like uncharacterized kinase
MSLIVVKVGGSLYDLPDFAARLTRYLATLDAPRILLVPGGGAAVDVVRAFTGLHHISEEDAHWLALRTLSLNAQVLAALLPGTPVVEDAGAFGQGIAILDGLAFARADESRPGHLPHTWAATSDSLAARVAHVAGARSLVLLKSTSIPPNTSWNDAARQGWVDPFFSTVLRSEPDGEAAALNVKAVNFREW